MPCPARKCEAPIGKSGREKKEAPMKIHVARGDWGNDITNVWLEDVPLDLSDEDVAYSVKLLAERGDKVASLALPYIRCCLSNYKDGVRVYLDEA
jgi:hypothetical protein